MKTFRVFLFCSMISLLLVACVVVMVVLISGTTIEVSHGNFYMYHSDEVGLQTTQGIIKVRRTTGWVANGNPLKFGQFGYLELYVASEYPDFVIFGEDVCNIILDDGSFLEIKNMEVSVKTTSDLEACYSQ